MRPSINLLRLAALATALAALGGCSEYLDRRDTIALNGGDSVEANKVTHIVDPWPRASANRKIGYNGEKMNAAVARYRTNRVYEPQGIGTANSYQPGNAPPANSTPVGPTVTQPAAPVK